MNRCFTHILADPKYSFENLQSCFLTRGAFGKNSSGVEENQKYQRHWAQYHYSRESEDLSAKQSATGKLIRSLLTILLKQTPMINSRKAGIAMKLFPLSALYSDFLNSRYLSITSTVIMTTGKIMKNTCSTPQEASSTFKKIHMQPQEDCSIL